MQADRMADRLDSLYAAVCDWMQPKHLNRPALYIQLGAIAVTRALIFDRSDWLVDHTMCDHYKELRNFHAAIKDKARAIREDYDIRMLETAMYRAERILRYGSAAGLIRTLDMLTSTKPVDFRFDSTTLRDYPPLTHLAQWLNT